MENGFDDATNNARPRASPPDYEFGPVVDTKNLIVGFIMRMTQPLPPEVDDLIGATLGEATLDDPGHRVWKLTKPIRDTDNEWEWFIHGVEWKSDDRVQFTKAEVLDKYAEGVCNLGGPELDFYAATDTLIQQYREWRRKVDPIASAIVVDEPTDHHQRLKYLVWNLRPKHKDLKPVHRVILFAILKHCWSAPSCTVGEELLAAECWTSVRTLQRALPVLVEHGYIQIKINPNHASTYTILDKSWLPPYRGGRKK